MRSIAVARGFRRKYFQKTSLSASRLHQKVQTVIATGLDLCEAMVSMPQHAVQRLKTPFVGLEIYIYRTLAVYERGRRGVQRRRGTRTDPVSEDDILRAITKLGVLGGGFSVVRVGERRLVRAFSSAHKCNIGMLFVNTLSDLGFHT